MANVDKVEAKQTTGERRNNLTYRSFSVFFFLIHKIMLKQRKIIQMKTTPKNATFIFILFPSIISYTWHGSR